MKLKLATEMLALAVSAITPALAEDLSFKLTNDSSSGVSGFYVSHVGTKSWEENLIEGGVLPPGNEMSIEIADGRSVCDYDIRGEFEDGSKFEDYNLDLCELGSYTFQDAD